MWTAANLERGNYVSWKPIPASRGRSILQENCVKKCAMIYEFSHMSENTYHCPSSWVPSLFSRTFWLANVSLLPCSCGICGSWSKPETAPRNRPAVLHIFQYSGMHAGRPFIRTPTGVRSPKTEEWVWISCGQLMGTYHVAHIHGPALISFHLVHLDTRPRQVALEGSDIHMSLRESLLPRFPPCLLISRYLDRALGWYVRPGSVSGLQGTPGQRYRAKRRW